MAGWEGGSTWTWRKIRRQVLERDRYRCQLGLDVCKTIADCVHHLDGKALGDDPRRLVASCTPCNLKVGNPLGRSGSGDPDPAPRTAW